MARIGGRSERAATRRAGIVNGAIELFGRHGFRSVNIETLGAAAGVSGPALYRHFASKADLLAEIFDRLTRQMLAAVAVSKRSSGEPRLRALLDEHVALAFADRNLIQLFLTEERSLLPRDRQRVRMARHRYLHAWIDALGQLRPDQGVELRRTAIHAVLWLVNSVAYDPPPDPVAAADLLRKMAMAALLEGTAATPAERRPPRKAAHPTAARSRGRTERPARP